MRFSGGPADQPRASPLFVRGPDHGPTVGRLQAACPERNRVISPACEWPAGSTACEMNTRAAASAATEHRRLTGRRATPALACAEPHRWCSPDRGARPRAGVGTRRLTSASRAGPPRRPYNATPSHHPPMDTLTAFLASLDLTPIDADRFEGHAVERARPRLFGAEL